MDNDYAIELESLGNGVQIVRLDAGPEEYIPKEGLWDYLDTFADNALNHIRELAPRFLILSTVTMRMRVMSVFASLPSWVFHWFIPGTLWDE